MALLVSPDTRWAFHIQPTTKALDYNGELREYYDALRRRGVDVNIIFPQSDFSAYKVIVAPSLFVASPVLVQKLTQFVQAGGTLVLTFRSGAKDDHNAVTLETLPGPFSRMVGVVIHNFDPQVGQQQEIITQDGSRYPAGVWYDVLTPTTAATLATYGKRYYAGRAAITENHSGKGTVFYVGTQPAPAEFYDLFMAHVLKAAGVKRGPNLPAGVELASREKVGRKILFVLNYTNQKKSVALGESTHNALTGASEPATITIAPYDVLVLTTPRA